MREFRSLTEFADFLVARAHAAKHAEHAALRECGEIVRDEAKELIGDYPAAFGDFPEWEQLAESTQDTREALGFSRNEPGLRTGEMRAAVECQVVHREAQIGVPSRLVGTGTRDDPVRDIGDVAKWFELGTKTQPPRSFLGLALAMRAEECVKIIAEHIGAAIADVMPRHHRP